MARATSMKKWCPQCKRVLPESEFWSRVNTCKDCTSKGEKRGLEKNGNQRLTLRVPDPIANEIRRIARDRGVTLSRAVTDLLRGVLG